MNITTYVKYRQVKVTKTGKERFDRKATVKAIKNRLEYLRNEIVSERISYDEIAELKELKEFIDSGYTLLLEWAGVPEL